MSTPRNRLSSATSPYLKAAAHQPVHWNPWDDAAFERAKREDRPILLDIGASWCHWCHVMDAESYDDSSVAAIINEHFVAVKVDRDERPDVDARYQSAVSAITGQGGWPLTAFLTPEGQTFYGGTYFPPVERFNRPSFKSVLLAIADAFKSKRQQVNEQAHRLTEALKTETPIRAESSKNSSTNDELGNAAESILRLHDPLNGGFGEAPKFFHAPALEFLLMQSWHTGEARYQEAVLRTLDSISNGGIRDHLGGGFHRYSTDRSWLIPHFEKMAYDNAALLILFTHAYQITRNERYRSVAREIIRFVRVDLFDPTISAFYSSQDADVGLDDDGGYFTWNNEEISLILQGIELDVLTEWFNLGKLARMPHNPDQNVLYLSQGIADLATRLNLPIEECERLLFSAIRKLQDARSMRSRPAIDASVYANLNGMLIQAFVEAGMAFGDEELIQTGLHVFDVVSSTLCQANGSYRHSAGGPQSFLDDQVHMGVAALACYEASGISRYLTCAQAIRSVLLTDYYDGENGGFFDSPSFRRNKEGSLPPFKPHQDSLSLSSNAGAVTFLQRLDAIATDASSQLASEKSLLWMQQFAFERPLYFAGCLQAIALSAYGVTKVEFALMEAEKRKTYQQIAASIYTPGRMIDWGKSDSTSALRTSRALVCLGSVCLPPVSNPEELTEQLRNLSRLKR